MFYLKRLITGMSQIYMYSPVLEFVRNSLAALLSVFSLFFFFFLASFTIFLLYVRTYCIEMFIVCIFHISYGFSMCLESASVTLLPQEDTRCAL